MPFFVLRLVLVLGGIVGGVFGFKKFTENAEKKYFNNGVCKKCGGHFRIIEGTKESFAKGYRCDCCDNCVWISYGSDVGYEYKPSKDAVQVELDLLQLKKQKRKINPRGKGDESV